MAKSIIKEKSYEFALQIVKLRKQLRQNKHFETASQLLRSDKNVGANVEEAPAAQSRKDFFAKMSIASKETRETNYRLRFIRDADIINNQQSQKTLEALEELIKILTSIVKIGNDNKQGHERTTKNSKLRTQN